MKKIILILSLVILVLMTAIVVMRFGLVGSEDSWLCQKGVWIKHGNPQGPAPLTGCESVVNINNFEECAALGQPIMESYPRQCRFNNQTFTENIGNELEKADLIKVNNPRPNQKITSPLVISGEARGNWFFEASFPVELYDGNNNLLGTGNAQAQGDWMTVNFVPFSLSISFTQPQTPNGLLILKKDNPSGLPEYDDQLEVPVFFQ
jgi:hypothetical protein